MWLWGLMTVWLVAKGCRTFKKFEKSTKMFLQCGPEIEKKCFNGNWGGVLWTEGQHRKRHTNESKCISDTRNTKTLKYQPVEVLFRYNTLVSWIPTKTINCTFTLTWTVSQEWILELVLFLQAFGKSKELLKSSIVLVNYETALEIILARDASPYVIGAVIAYMVNGVLSYTGSRKSALLHKKGWEMLKYI